MATDDRQNDGKRTGMRIEGEQARLLMQRLQERMHEEEPSDRSAVEDVLETSPGVPEEQTPIHSDQVQEILGYIPHWIVRWGIALILLIVVALLGMSWFVKYPDTIAAPVEVAAANPPVYLRARSTGKLEHLLVRDNQSVDEGAYLAVLETTADFRHVLEIKDLLAGLRQRLADSGQVSLAGITFGRSRSLGELQADYQQLLAAVEEYRDFTARDFYDRKLRSLQSQIEQAETAQESRIRQLELLEQELDLMRQQHERVTALNERNRSSPLEVETSQSTLLQKEYLVETARLAVINGDTQLLQLRQAARDLQHDHLREHRQLRTSLRRAVDNLRSRVLGWEQQFVIAAPVAGTVSLMRYWAEHQNVVAGDNVAAVVPSDRGEPIGRIHLPLQGAGKVRTGQTVNVKFYHFPYEDYGVVQGVVRSKSLVPDGDSYLVTVGFPDGLTTNVGFEVPNAQAMKGVAEIVTDDIRLLTRLLVRSQTWLDSGS
jgi:HlyD family secretion protein